MARAHKVTGAYVLTLPKTGHIYVGSSVDIGGRKSVHLYELKNDKHPVKKLQENFAANGAVVVEVFPTTTREEAFQKEAELLQAHKDNPNLCNRTLDPYSSKGVRPDEEARRKMSESRKGRKHSEETKSKISAGNLGQTRTDEARHRMSQAQHALLERDPEALQRLRDLGQAGAKPIVFDGIQYDSIREAAREVGVERRVIKAQAK